MRVIQPMGDGSRLYVCGTNAHNPKDWVINVSYFIFFSLNIFSTPNYIMICTVEILREKRLLSHVVPLVNALVIATRFFWKENSSYPENRSGFLFYFLLRERSFVFQETSLMLSDDILYKKRFCVQMKAPFFL